MATVKGTGTPQLIGRTNRFVHGQGWSYAEQWGGTEEALNGLVQGFKVNGYSTDISGEGRTRTLTATKQAVSEANDQDYYDRFTITKERISIPIWSLEAVQTEGALYAVTTGTNFQEYRRIIEQSLEECDADLLPSAATYPYSHLLHDYLAKGGEEFEDEYTVVTRERVVGIRYAPQLQLRSGNVAMVYTTAQWQATFGIGAFSGISLPSTPATAPEQTMWGWRTRRQEVEYLGANKVHVTQDWAFAAWSTFLYTPA